MTSSDDHSSSKSSLSSKNKQISSNDLQRQEEWEAVAQLSEICSMSNRLPALRKYVKKLEKLRELDAYCSMIETSVREKQLQLMQRSQEDYNKRVQVITELTAKEESSNHQNLS